MKFVYSSIRELDFSDITYFGRVPPDERAAYKK